MKEDSEKKEALAEPKKDGTSQSADTAANTAQKENKEQEPVITHEEFKKLEKKEENKKIFGFLKKFKKDKPASLDDSKSSSAHELEKKLNNALLKVEKLEGKFEMIQSSKSETSERMANLAEEVGELRSMIFSKEDTFARIEDEFEKTKEAAAHMKPEKIHREIEDQAAEVMKVQAQQELQKNRLDQIGKATRKTEKILDKFKSYENMLDISKQIRKQAEKINDSEKYTARMAAKTEKIFAELDSRLSEFQKYKKEIDDTNEMLRDMIKSTDSIEVKTDSLLSKDSFAKVKQEQDNKSAELDTRIKTLKDIVGTMLDKMSAEGRYTASCDPGIKSGLNETILRDFKGTIHTELDKKISMNTEKLKGSISQMAGQVSMIRSDGRTIKDDLANLKQDIDMKISAASTAEYENITEKITRLNKKIVDASGTTANILSILQKKEQSLLQNIANLKQDSDKKATAVSSLKRNLQLHTEQFSKMEASQKAGRTAIKRQTLETINAKMEEFKKYNSALKQIKKDINSLKQEKDSIKEEQASKLSKTTDKTNKNIKDFSDSLANLEDNQRYLKDSIDMPSGVITTLNKKIKSGGKLYHSLDAKINSINAQVLKLQKNREPQKHMKDEFATQTNNPKPVALSATEPKGITTVEPHQEELNKQMEHDDSKHTPHKSTPQQSKSDDFPSPVQEPREQSLCQKHMQQVKNIFRKVKPPQSSKNAADNQPHPGYSHEIQEPAVHPVTESEDIKQTLKETIEQNRKLGKDLKSEIQRLKTLYEQKQSLLEKEKSSGKDIFRQQILLDNASLDLGMAEIDLLDGNELQTRQKIEKVSISLENI